MMLPGRFWVGIAGAFIALQLLFLANMCYIYGTAFHDSQRYSAMHVLYVDYDQGAIGQSVLAAYNTMQSPAVVTLEQHPVSEYPTEREIEQALTAAVQSPEAAQAYDRSQALQYYWKGTKYSAYATGVYSQLTELVQITAAVYAQTHGAGLLAAASSSNLTDPAIAATLLLPVGGTAVDVAPTDQGVRFYYNNVSMVMPIIQQFFFIMALNSLSAQFALGDRLSTRQHLLLRIALSLVYSFVGALVMTGYIWAFRESWALTGGQFALSWMAIWLVMHLHFLFIDFVAAFLPAGFLPFFVLTWIILNVSSSIIPFELSPGFYRIGYAFPAYELYEVLLQIWTDGCNPYLYRALPILWSEWLVALGLFFVGMRHRGKTVTRASVLDDKSSLR
ncbi:putative nitrosoguanidine resistance protein SNG1 [Aspergillus steynii IBT 23096]|uniref:Putative nitrosoguanidine resistance protein SNG1 n=1 Tax=Aspergillus steynii IBT 23096 TaxID=1392250 RepID=A0A2I2G445_9EURO|nr:putative nitrosoguanidine resistance protein SNG1 [Aspergillus steynii IBT 23096]PLB47654.1 putative nitrosoguanidine resistance protein SNG1 [Aspergillus steynii IBT 23096]